MNEHDSSEQLVLESVRSDGEVEQRDFDLQLRRVVRVRQSCGDVQMETIVVRNRDITQLDVRHSFDVDDLLQQQRLEGGIQGLGDILEQNPGSQRSKGARTRVSKAQPPSHTLLRLIVESNVR